MKEKSYVKKGKEVGSNIYKLRYLQELFNVVLAISDILETTQTVMLFSYHYKLREKELSV